MDELYSLTIEQLKEIFDAGYDYRSSLSPEIIEEHGENCKPDFKEFIEEFINSLT